MTKVSLPSELTRMKSKTSTTFCGTKQIRLHGKLAKILKKDRNKQDKNIVEAEDSIEKRLKLNKQQTKQMLW